MKSWLPAYFGALEDARVEIKQLREKVAQQEAALIRASDALAAQKRTLDTAIAAIRCVKYLLDENKTLGS